MTVAHRQILQLAFAALVTDRTVQRVVDQQELHHRLLGVDGLLRVRVHLMPAVTGVAQAGRALGAFSTSTRHMRAAGGDGEFLVIAEMRHVDARRVGGVHHHAAFGDRYLLPIDFDFDHNCPVRFTQREVGTRQVLCST